MPSSKKAASKRKSAAPKRASRAPGAKANRLASSKTVKSKAACLSRDLANLRVACKIAGIDKQVRAAGHWSDKVGMCMALKAWADAYHAAKARAAKKSGGGAKKASAAPARGSASAPSKSRHFKVVSAKLQSRAGAPAKDVMTRLASGRYSGSHSRAAGKAFTAVMRSLHKSGDARARAVFAGAQLRVEVEETTRGANTASRGYTVSGRRAPPKGKRNPYGARYTTKVSYRC